MTSTVVFWGRASPLVVVAVVLCCGNAILQAADAFQTRTTGLRTILRSSQSGAIAQPFQMNYRQPRRLFLTVASPESATNTTSTDESVSLAAELEEKPVSDAFFVPMLDEESVTTTSTRKRGRKRRAIQRMKENRFSRSIDSRLVRALLFPMVSLFNRYNKKYFDLNFSSGYLTRNHLSCFFVEDVDMESSMDGNGYLHCSFG